MLSDIDGITKKDATSFENASIVTVSDLLGAEEETLLDIKGITANKIEKVYSSIEAFIESDNKEEEVEEVDVKELIEDLDEKLDVDSKEAEQSEEAEQGEELEQSEEAENADLAKNIKQEVTD